MDAAQKRFSEAVEACSDLAREELAQAAAKVDLGDPTRAVPLLKAAVSAIVQRYGSLAALVAAEYYESVRSGYAGGTYRAQLAEPVDAGVIDAAVEFACRDLWKRGDDG